MRVMQSDKRVSNILLSVTLFILLGVTAYFQLSWAMDLRQLEQQRLQNALAKNIVKLTSGIHQELYLLPTLAMTNDTDFSSIEKSVGATVRFWETHSTSSSLFAGIYLYIPSRQEQFFEWQKSTFIPVDKGNLESLQYYTSVFLERRRDDASSLLISLPDDKILFMNQVAGRGSSERCFILCIVNYTELTEKLIPGVISSVFDETESYNYRLYNASTGKTLYISDPHISAQVFALPDFTLPLLPFSNSGYNINLHPLPVEKFPFTPEFYSFIKDRMRNFAGELPPDLPIYDTVKNVFLNPWNGRGWKQDTLMLEFVHKDGSLFRASVKATMQNIITSLIVLIILGIGMLILIINNQKAQRLARRQQEFISTITHELKTPLAVISSAAQNLSDGIINNPEKIRRYGQIIQKEDVRLHSSIEYFLLYSHLNTSARFIQKKTDLVLLVETALTRTEQLCAENGFKVEKFLPLQPLDVYCDMTAILSVIQNLITNAIKHAESGHYLGVSLTKENVLSRILRSKTKCGKKSKTIAVLRVIDHGKGIPKKEQKTIFEAFSRGSNAINMQIEGSGIGLNLAKRIVVMHGGVISIESSNQQGTIFAVTLPCVENENGGIV